MRIKKLLAAFLLGAGLCFVPVWGYGEVKHWMDKETATYMDFRLLRAEVSYIRHNPTNFLNVTFWYDRYGKYRSMFPEDVDTKGRIFVLLTDTRGTFFGKSGITLLDQFKRELEVIYSFIDLVATDMDTDVVAKLVSKGGIPLAYFYRGEYHLWGE